MARPVFEDAAEIPNSVRTVYRTSVAYASGSVRVWRNGQLKRSDLQDGFRELGNRKVEFKEAPLTGDHITFYYLPI